MEMDTATTSGAYGANISHMQCRERACLSLTCHNSLYQACSARVTHARVVCTLARMPPRYLFALGFYMYATVTHEAEGARSAQDLIEGRNLIPLMVLQSEVSKCVGFFDAKFPDGTDVELPIGLHQHSGLFIKCKLRKYVPYISNSARLHHVYSPISWSGSSYGLPHMRRTVHVSCSDLRSSKQSAAPRPRHSR